ncbi:MAG: DUF4410 domain-containing protein [Gammaproteobacteria bacterium]|nr:MAG: DUF4410 domain-containing protein [Gammaproteobacteria bacterium]
MTKSPKSIFVLLFSGITAVLTGCASSDVTHRQELAAQEQVARPGQIIVYNFGITPADIPASSAISGHYVQREKSLTDREYMASRRLGALAAKELVGKIRSMGISAQRAGNEPTPAIGDVAITGQFITIEEGSRGKRVVIGFGAGSAELNVHVEGYLLTKNGPRLLGSRQVVAAGGKMPGIAVPILARSPAGLAVNSALKTKGEKGAEKLEEAAKRIADEIAKELETVFRRGWI